MSKAKLELLTEEQKDLYLFFEHAIRGGLSRISDRYAKTEQSWIRSRQADDVADVPQCEQFVRYVAQRLQINFINSFSIRVKSQNL